jgi:hypothetical protein
MDRREPLMPRRMTFDIDVELPAARMYSLFTQVDYWQDLVEFYQENAGRTEIAHFSTDDNGTHVTFNHIMTADDLPPIARPVLPGTFVVTREQHFEPFDTPANQALGRYLAHIPAPVELTGDYLLADTERGSRMRLESLCRVQVPLIGGQIEQLVMSGLKMLFAKEGEFTADWIAGHR